MLKISFVFSDFIIAITASAVSMSGTVVASGGEIGGFVIDSSEVKSTNNNLRLKDSGQITASNAQILGNITADTIVATGSGVIGGFTLDAHSLTSTGVEINNSSQTLFISSSAFKVAHSGNVTASNISMSGTVIADSGEIGGFTIGTDLANSAGSATEMAEIQQKSLFNQIQRINQRTLIKNTLDKIYKMKPVL